MTLQDFMALGFDKDRIKEFGALLFPDRSARDLSSDELVMLAEALTKIKVT